MKYSGNTNTFKIREFLYRSSVCDIRRDRKYNKSYDPSLKIIPKNQHRFRKVAGHGLVGKDTVVLETMAYGKRLDFDPKAIWACCVGRRKAHKNYIWSYIND